MSRTYKFRTPSNQLITINDKYAYRDIITIEDLKYLFTLKNRLYTVEMFEIAKYNNMTKQNDILPLDTIIDINVDIYELIHIYNENNPDLMEFEDVQITTITDDMPVETNTTDDMQVEANITDNQEPTITIPTGNHQETTTCNYCNII